MANTYTYTVGRRKTATATVRLFEESGESKINDKEVSKLYPVKSSVIKLLEPFEVAGLDAKKFMFTAKTSGGGSKGQLEAIRLGIARAIASKYPEKKKDLKQLGLLTRDPRMVERKKAGLRKARKAEQYSKR